MKCAKRIEQLLPGTANQLWLGTFHSVAARALRRWGELIGIQPSFLIYDEDDSKRCMRQISNETFGMSLDEFKACMKHVARWRNQGQQPQQIDMQQDQDEAKQRGFHIYHAYCQKASRYRCIGFQWASRWMAAFATTRKRKTTFSRLYPTSSCRRVSRHQSYSGQILC